MSADISLTNLEKLINHWRLSKPSTGEESTLSPEVNALASVYAQMIYERRHALPISALPPFVRQLIEEWMARQEAMPSQAIK
ncbi:uncharacterized protein DUF3717 [Paucimonas lemoignei]|uniref:Uncharacterized protein DUF3717 n=1 Tax=Paucimonas lemoignei TaxID=29443 RepID=A0A4R3HPG4_PAULE|nr:DUF3717 domain-containing protein [Paucimonas lemoignei]TCS32765.1 uncharacterized protein DUF3717 [Paucimonas lemoignei]